MIPETHTLTLQKVTITQGSTGSISKSWDTVQNIAGSLQPARILERIDLDKQTVKADYIFYFAKSKFTSSANEAELKESNQFIYGSRIFLIKGVIDWSINPYFDYYKVLLLEIK